MAERVITERPKCETCERETSPVGGIIRPGKRAYQCTNVACPDSFKKVYERKGQSG